MPLEESRRRNKKKMLERGGRKTRKGGEKEEKNEEKITCTTDPNGHLQIVFLAGFPQIPQILLWLSLLPLRLLGPCLLPFFRVSLPPKSGLSGHFCCRHLGDPFQQTKTDEDRKRDGGNIMVGFMCEVFGLRFFLIFSLHPSTLQAWRGGCFLFLQTNMGLTRPGQDYPI